MSDKSSTTELEEVSPSTGLEVESPEAKPSTGALGTNFSHTGFVFPGVDVEECQAAHDPEDPQANHLDLPAVDPRVDAAQAGCC